MHRVPVCGSHSIFSLFEGSDPSHVAWINHKLTRVEVLGSDAQHELVLVGLILSVYGEWKRVGVYNRVLTQKQVLHFL